MVQPALYGKHSRLEQHQEEVQNYRRHQSRTSHTGPPKKWRTYQVQGVQKWPVPGKHQGDPTKTKH